VPIIGSAHPHFAARPKRRRIIETRSLNEFNLRCLWPPDRDWRAAFAAEPAARGSPAVRRDCVEFRLCSSVSKSVRGNAKRGRMRAATCSLAVAAMADQFDDGSLITLIPHSSARTSARKAFAHRNLLNPNCNFFSTRRNFLSEKIPHVLITHNQPPYPISLPAIFLQPRSGSVQNIAAGLRLC
jgi:hypothetical protein